MYNKKWNAPIICFLVFFICILFLFVQFCYLSLSKNIYGINMKEFAANRNTVKTVINANRGTIYDVEGNVLAQTVSSYTLIAYLDPKRTTDEDNPNHVVNKTMTAEKLSAILGEEYYDYILQRLNKEYKQVEFGNIGKNLTELTKLSIEELQLPGISFLETSKRFYPNGNFSSYIIGYAKQYTRVNLRVDEEYNLYNDYSNFFENYDNVTINIMNEDIISLNDKTVIGNEIGSTKLLIKTNGDVLANIVFNIVDNNYYDTTDEIIVGELGIESKFNKILQGTDGYIEYQQDKYGYKIPDTPEVKVDAVDGSDIYLTLDSNIQRFTENTIKEITENYDPDWAIVSVMDAKSGAILASSTSPSYNPNNLPNDMSYQNPLVSYTYEPGSVMKTYTYMCAMETGNYDGSKMYLSGEYVLDDGTIIHDWNNSGWGMINYDTGFSYSSNVGIINIIKDYLSQSQLMECFEKFGFNKKTNIELSNEETGNLNFQYESEIMSAGFGQGISTTAIQQLQALTIIANNGVMVQPHIIDKIVNKTTKKEEKTEIVKSDKLVSDETISKIKDLMESVINTTNSTGKKYYIENYDIIGKTGTAQIYQNGRYLIGDNNYIFSVGLMYPKDNPEIIIYAAVKQPESGGSNCLSSTIPELIKNISNYKEMFSELSNEENNNLNVMDSYINNNLSESVEKLNELDLNVIVIGDGDKIINQYPKSNKIILSNDVVYLFTNYDEYLVPDFTGLSRIDTIKLCELLNINYSFSGTGYVSAQSIEKNSKIFNGIKIEFILN